MSKHPIDHDRARDDGKVAKEYARIERQQDRGTSDPKVKAMTKAAQADIDDAEAARLKAFVKIEREISDS
jgi:hypothetical protein